ncbi:hypothetical protein LVJ85_08015 [Neisseria sp. Dent CA1/247]|uniref:hypothetical protein n=1 Tax=Neisseria sp. Dent CA1/247 TaxID=2912675 RepID=UPI001FCF976B|nr:hypothetical protein [Neisseria sp. Dent CA1/247]UOO75992.1 hypothetical protein LVJ85_08015 [Neisseria sp. Dent CA1/247]
MNNTEQELAKLVLKNLDMLEKSYELLGKIDDEFYHKIDTKFQEWYKEVKQDTMWPMNLEGKKESEAIWFTWDVKTRHKISTHEFKWLSVFTDLGRYEDGEIIESGIRFGFNRNFFTLTAKESKSFMQKQFEKYPELSQANFQYVGAGSEERVIFLPVKLDLERLLEEYPNYTDALLPLDEAFDAVIEHMLIFKAIARDLMEGYLKKEYQQEE